jgi:tRNA U54 and U55 pseudouridine synthase Pus10
LYQIQFLGNQYIDERYSCPRFTTSNQVYNHKMLPFKFNSFYFYREESNQIKEGEEEKTKCYDALCYTDTQIDQTELDQLLAAVPDLLIIEQKTPIRVLHR